MMTAEQYTAELLKHVVNKNKQILLNNLIAASKKT
jgi:hypothetical protein